MSENTNNQMQATNITFKNSKDSMLIEIPSMILNNLIDENGDIKAEAEIPEEIMKLFS